MNTCAATILVALACMPLFGANAPATLANAADPPNPGTDPRNPSPVDDSKQEPPAPSRLTSLVAPDVAKSAQPSLTRPPNDPSTPTLAGTLGREQASAEARLAEPPVRRDQARAWGLRGADPIQRHGPPTRVMTLP